MTHKDARADAPHGPAAPSDAPTARSATEDLLVLAPLDSDARDALRRIVLAGGFGHEDRGFLFVFRGGPAVFADLMALLRIRASSALKLNVKGVVVRQLNTEADRVAACLEAAPLVEMLDNAEVDWIRDALRDNWLYSVYQPIVEARSGGVFAYEALARATDPQSGDTYTAGRLLYASSRLNLEHAFDQQARAAAIRGAAALDLPDVKYFVNFSPGAIYDPEVCLQRTMDAARDCGMPLCRLVFDVVDASDLDAGEQLAAILAYYRQRGASVALDDVTGSMNSLQLIADLRPDFIKVDCSAIGQSSAVRSRSRLEPLVGLSKSLSIRVVAKGIETAEEMHLCAAAGVDFMQGYLFARPANPPMPVRTDFVRQTSAAA